MIKNTFVFLKRISYEGEKKFWKKGIKTWEDFLNCKKIAGISNERKKMYDSRIRIMQNYLQNKNYEKILEAIPKRFHYRMYNELNENAIYLDIETYAYNRGKQITLAGLSDGMGTRILSPSRTGWEQVINKISSPKNIIITYNGSVHDIPTIEKQSGKKLQSFILDLRFLLSELGFSGGLKEAEYDFGIAREKAAIRKSGEPLKLWKLYLATHDEHFLELLQKYLEQDVESLIIIAEKTVSMYKKINGLEEQIISSSLNPLEASFQHSHE